MFGVKVLLNTFAILLIICALAVIWVNNPSCGIFVARCIASMFVIIAVLTSRETARL